MVIRVLDVAGGADTQEQGQALHLELVESLKMGDVIVVSFEGVDIATSSFVNASFLPLLTNMKFDELKRRVRIISVTRQVGDMIKRRLIREAAELVA